MAKLFILLRFKLRISIGCLDRDHYIDEDEEEVGMCKGPKRTLKLVNYRLESRPLTDPGPRSLGLDLDLTQNRAQPNHFM